MIKIKFAFILSLIVITFLPLNAQNKTLIKDLGIKSLKVREYFLDESSDDFVVEKEEKYNDAGNLIEIREFSKKGEVKRWEKYAYNPDGLVSDEIFLDETGKIIRIEKTIYKGLLKTEKQFFNSKNKLYKKKVYVYEYTD